MAQLDLEEICEGELEVLSQIFAFPGELTDLRNGAKYDDQKCYIPPQISFRLGPQESRSFRQQPSEYTVSLIVHLTSFYPTAVPSKLTVTPFGSSLSDFDVSELISELSQICETKSKSCVPYLYDLCYTAQEILHQIKNQTFHKPTLQNEDPRKTLAQERSVANRNEKPSYLDAHPDHELSRISLPYVEVEVETDEFKIPLYKSRILSDDLNSMGFERRLVLHPDGTVFMSHMITILPRAMNRLEERLEKMANFCRILHDRLKMAANRSSYLLTPYAITIEQAIDIASTDDCDYLRDYFDDTTTPTEALQNAARVYLIYPYLHDKRLLDPVDIDGLKNLTRNILNAIEALRSSEIGHGHISESHMLIEPIGHNLQLSGAGMKQLVKKSTELGFTIIGYQQDENLMSNSDLNNIGNVLGKLNKKLVLTNQEETDFDAFIRECFQRKVVNGPNVRALVNSNFVKRKCKNTNSDGENSEISVESEQSDKFDENSQIFTKDETFQVVNYIGSGAFGTVAKVLNTVDGQVYAVKKIRLETKEEKVNQKILREANLLSRLSHESVVRYYHSWKECQITNVPNNSTKRIRTESTKESLTNDSLLKLNNLQFKSIRLDENARGNWSDEWSDEMSDDDDYESEVSSSEEETDQKSEKSPVPSFGESEKTEDDVISREYLFIQMEFCSNRTLKDEIYGDAGLTTDRAWALFREILEGLNYIHGKKTVHRDLKPGNIFLDSAYRAKIGDFGLAKEHSAPEWARGASRLSLGNISDTPVSSPAGTPLYIAPECLRSLKKSEKAISAKVDMYSLGIIMFEMFYKMDEGRERLSAILQLRNNNTLPDDFKGPYASAIIHRLTHQSPDKRSSAGDILSDASLMPIQSHLLIESDEKVRNAREICRAACQTSSSRTRDAITHELFNAAPMTQMERMLFDIDDFENVKNKIERDCSIPNVRNFLTSIFHHRGHAYLDLPLLSPAADDSDVEGSTVKLLASCGSRVILPSSDRRQFLNYCRLTKTVSERSYQQFSVFEKRHLDKRHPRRRDIFRADIVAVQGQGQLIELISSVGHLSDSVPDGALEIHLNHGAISSAILARYALRGDADVARLRTQLTKHSHCRAFRYAHKIQNLWNDRKFRRATRKYVTKDAEFIDALNARPIKAGFRFQLQKLPKATELVTAELATFAAALAEMCPNFPVLFRPSLLNGNFMSGINFQIVLRSGVKSKNMLNDDTRVIADGGEYNIPDTGARRNIKGYGIDYHLQQMAEGNEIKINNTVTFQPVRVMIVSHNSSEKYPRISILNMLEREGIPTMIYDSKSVGIDLRDFREEFLQFALGHQVMLILQIVHSTKINCYDQPFDRFLKKAHQVTKPESLTGHSGVDRFTVAANPDQKEKNLSIVEYVRQKCEEESSETDPDPERLGQDRTLSNLLRSHHGSSKKYGSSSVPSRISASAPTDRPIEIIYVTIKGHSGDTQRGKNKWKDDIYKDIERSVRTHPIYSTLNGICVVVSEVNADAIRQLAAYLDLNNISRSKDFINRKISAPTTTKKLLDRMVEATIEMTRKGLNVVIGSFEDNVYKLVN